MEYLPKEVSDSEEFDISHKINVIKSGNKFFLAFLQNYFNYIIPACFYHTRWSLKDDIKEVKINDPICSLVGIRFRIIDKNPYMEIPVFHYLKDYICYQRKRMVILPVHFSAKGIEGKNNHIAVFFIDTFYKKAYLVDPNTKSFYYKTIFEKPLELVENALSFICDNLKIEYQKQDSWVTWKKSVNRRLKIDHPLFEVGNCYLISFTFILMNSKNVTLKKIHKIIGSLSDEDFTKLISKMATYLFSIKPKTCRKAWDVFEKN